MRLIKLFFFLFLLSSCNKYLGIVETDYTPVNDIKDISVSNINVVGQTEEIFFGSIKYPKSKSLIKNFDFFNIKKTVTLEEHSKIFLTNDSIYYSKKNSLVKINKSDNKDKVDYKVNLDKDEKIIKIFENNNQISFLTNKFKLFKLIGDTLNLELNKEIYINTNPILLDDKMLIFTVFGEVLEINLNNYEILSKGQFPTFNGVVLESNSYVYDDFRSYLFNSGTLIFLNRFNNQIQTNYYLDDLNILSSMSAFKEFIDAPFAFDNNLYFIEKKGYLSVFNPLTSTILWEVDLNSSVKDYIFSVRGYLGLLTNDKIFLLDKKGNLILEFSHNIKDPISFLINEEEIFIFNSKGVSIFDIDKKKLKIFIKSKLNYQLDIIDSNSGTYIKDDRSLYQLSE
mgnify:CR=1 FL=1|tara:strand:- start:17781 stop:18971 length:1191 start_codon:yes stop_codon:yes gene_type:complete